MKVLILYSSGYGSTKEIAEKISAIFAEQKAIQTTVTSIDNVNAIDDYDGLIIGSSVRADLPLANVRDFIVRERFVLPTKKVAFFAVCLAANCDHGRDEIKKNFIMPVFSKYPEIKLVSMEAFGGKIDFDKLNPVMKNLMIKVLEKTGLPTAGSVDTRDWEFISSWAIETRQKFLGE
ncbi:MAG TPA: flavodoxin domain-containing protein [bacterium]|nr:flavodoxin domain-containing protein [bacterium]HPN42799.1 flavodoxin domain-containing protein [bacterium]